VLVAFLAAALIAGFPLFCLICPIGLTFGTVGSLWHLIVDKQVTLSVVVFPLALVVELVAYRKWCLNLCPVGGLMAIVGQFAPLARPRVNASTCLRYSKGVECTVCEASCPEQLSLHERNSFQQLGECTRCGVCMANCPTASISLKLAAASPVVAKELADDHD
jgi:ferredoxin-type protein NapH